MSREDRLHPGFFKYRSLLTLQALLLAGVDAEDVDESGESALHLLARAAVAPSSDRLSNEQLETLFCMNVTKLVGFSNSTVI